VRGEWSFILARISGNAAVMGLVTGAPPNCRRAKVRESTDNVIDEVSILFSG
jgi:hypothetical protein